MSKRPPLTAEEREEIAVLRGEKGWSWKRIANRIGCSAGAVSWWCLVDAIEKPGPVPAPIPWTGPMVAKRGAFEVRRFSAEDDARLLELEAEGLSNLAIGRQIGRRPNSIKGRLATLARREERALTRAEMSR